MADSLTDMLGMMMGSQGGQAGQGAPNAGGGVGGGEASPNADIQRVLKQGLQSKTSLSPLQISPKMKQSGLGQDIGMSLLNMFVPQIGGTLQKHIKQQKEQQINQVVNDFTILHNAWEEAQQIAGGDEEKAKQMFGQDPRVSSLFGDKKKIKLLSKAFGIDLMNPEKTQNNVAFQGLQRFLKLKDAKGKIDAIKAMQEQRKSQPQQGQQGQPQQGQQGQGGQVGEANPQDLAQNFLKMWPKDIQKPSMADAEKAAMTQQHLVEASIIGEPKTEFQAWFKGFQQDNGRKPTGEEVEAHHEAAKLKPQEMLIAEAIDDIQNGDAEGGKQKLSMVKDVVNALHPNGHKNFLDAIYGANAGNADDKKAIDRYMALQDEMREAYAKGRARYQYNSYLFPDGTVRPMSGIDFANYLREHPQEVPPMLSGRLNATQEISIQQLITEAGPTGSPTYKTGALKGVYDNIKAFDNAKDRAIFAHALNKAEHSSDWLATMKNVLTQVETDKLSPDGQQLYVNLQRLAETMGRFRSSMGLPSTDQSMSLSLALLPGPTTPDSQFAKKMLDNLDQMIKQATVPALGGKIGQPKTSAPQKKKTLDELLNGK
jgi:hypothetical protein